MEQQSSRIGTNQDLLRHVLTTVEAALKKSVSFDLKTEQATTLGDVPQQKLTLTVEGYFPPIAEPPVFDPSRLVELKPTKEELAQIAEEFRRGGVSANDVRLVTNRVEITHGKSEVREFIHPGDPTVYDENGQRPRPLSQEPKEQQRLGIAAIFGLRLRQMLGF